MKQKKKWDQLKAKVADIADETKESSEDVVIKANLLTAELKDSYHRILKKIQITF